MSAIKLDASELIERMTGRVDASGLVESWLQHVIDPHLIRVCESPIEVMLGAALLFHDKLEGMPGFGLALALQEELPDWTSEARLLIPQYSFLEYHIDWVYRDGPNLTFIECDGHDYHERTKVQAARDKLRDRRIQAAGHPILRFTGSEIFKDPFACAAQISEFVDRRNYPPELREQA